MLAILSLLLAPAFGGELIVTTLQPVVVKVDGTPVEYVPGTLAVQVSGLQGIHRVEITSVTGKQLAQMNVSVPAQGGAGLAFDGTNLVMASAGATMTTTQTVAVAAPAPAPAPEPKGPEAMDSASFSKLLAAIDDASFSDDKLNVVRTAAGGSWFSIAQVGQIVDRMDFGGDKVAAVAACRSKVVDPQNAFQLSSHFDFSGDKEKALALFQ